MQARLARSGKESGNVELLIGQSNSVEETAALLKQAGPEAPVLAINLNCFCLDAGGAADSRRRASDVRLFLAGQRP